MRPQSLLTIRLQRKIAGWCVHIFTATGAFIGLLALLAIYHHQWLSAFWLMSAAVLIDAVDGMFARLIKIKLAVPEINGELLDNIVDFVNYTIVPCFFLLVTTLLPEQWRIICVLAITFSSAYQFTQIDAKTSDHFFKGFPSYWNIVIFYLFFWQMNEWVNVFILFILAILSFVPIKYIYPSRLDYLTHHAALRAAVLIATVIFGLTTGGLMWVYPQSSPLLVTISMSYMLLYVLISVYRTFIPLHPMPDVSNKNICASNEIA